MSHLEFDPDFEEEIRKRYSLYVKNDDIKYRQLFVLKNNEIMVGDIIHETELQTLISDVVSVSTDVSRGIAWLLDELNNPQPIRTSIKKISNNNLVFIQNDSILYTVVVPQDFLLNSNTNIIN